MTGRGISWRKRCSYLGEASAGPLVPPGKGDSMLKWAIIFFVVALIAAVFGFGGIAAGAASIAKIVFVGFVILAVAALLASAVSNRRTTV